MEFKYLLYLISISFQISGTFLLAYMGFTKKINNIAEEIVSFNFIGKDMDSIPIPQIASKLLEIYLIRIGFILVFFGYMLSILGERILNNLKNDFICIIIISFIVCLFSIIGLNVLVTKRKKKIEQQCKCNLPPSTIFYEEMD